MLLISHRGNINGSNSLEENNPHQVMNTVYSGYDCEIDLWRTDNGLFLGHDIPKYKIDYHFLVNNHLWIHCKNIEAFVHLSQDKQLHLFYHTDGIAITTKGYLWTAPGLLLGYKSIAVMPEMIGEWDIKGAYGICTDHVLKYSI
jgi:hypothetical protein